MNLNKILNETFGFADFRGLQEAVIQKILDGSSALAVFPTGSGKSLCFQFPALLLDGLTIVISPLLALMKDQVDFLEMRGIAAKRVDSTSTPTEVRELVDEIRTGKLKILYISPEKIASSFWLNLFSNTKISMFVIDEVHCVSEWGHNFRPDYLKLAKIAKRIAAERVFGLTATATKSVVNDICKTFKIATDGCFLGDFYRPELELKLSAYPESQKKSILLERLQARELGPTIVYVTLQKTAQEVANFLTENGLEAKFYHAGVRMENREQLQNEFMQSERMIIVATIAFGMGVDKSNIRYIYHYNLPKSIENYMQEIGRGGRDGVSTICELLAADTDITVLENFIYGDTPEASTVAALWEFIQSQPDHFSVSKYELSNQFDIRKLVLDTFFSYLELTAVVEYLGSYYSEIKINFIIPESEVLQQFDSNRAEFLQQFFSSGKMGRSYLSIDLDAYCQGCYQTRERVLKAINYLETQGCITTKLSGLRASYKFVRRDFDQAKALDYFVEKFVSRETNEIKRVGAVVDLVNSSDCKTNFLLNYFGGNILETGCQKCSTCQGVDQELLKDNCNYNFNDNDLTVIRQARELFVASATPRSISKFLCGISSPSFSAMRYTDASGKERRITSSALFGSLTKIPFAQVLTQLTS